MKTVEMQVPTARELYDSLPIEFHNAECWQGLVNVWSRVITMFIPDIMRESTVRPQLYMSLFQDMGGYQLICDWACSDLNKPRGNAYNFHLQNTSQWVYAGAIIFDKVRKEFSIHT